VDSRAPVVRVATAAPPGHRVRVDFSGEFDIERSDDCTYDYVELRDGPYRHTDTLTTLLRTATELRDGPYGFSALLGRYCGRRHPGTVV